MGIIKSKLKKPMKLMPKEKMDMEKPAGSIAEAIMRKRNEEKMMAEGGMVDDSDNDEPLLNEYDELNEMAADDEMEGDPEDSYEERNEDAAHEDLSDSDDMISKIRMKMRAKKGM